MVSTFSKTKSFSDLFTGEKLKTLGSFVAKTTARGIDTFGEARENAKITGKMLAHFLDGLPDHSNLNGSRLLGRQTFSLIGFSLGA